MTRFFRTLIIKHFFSALALTPAAAQTLMTPGAPPRVELGTGPGGQFMPISLDNQGYVLVSTGGSGTSVTSDWSPAAPPAVMLGVLPNGKYAPLSLDSSGNLLVSGGGGGGGGSITPTVVQYVANIAATANPSVTLPGAPTAGNLLVAFLSHYNNGYTPQNGYTLLYGHDGGNFNGFDIAYKIAGPGESATQSPFVISSTGNGLLVYEVSGAMNAPVMGGTLSETTASTATLTSVVPGNALVLGYLMVQNCPGSVSTPGTTPLQTVTSSILSNSRLSVLESTTTVFSQLATNVTQAGSCAVTGITAAVP